MERGVPVVAAARRPHSDTTLFQEARTPELKNLSNRGAGNSGQGLAEDPPPTAALTNQLLGIKPHGGGGPMADRASQLSF